MTKYEGIVLSAYTGFVLTKDFSDVHKFCEKLLDRPVFTHELATETVQNEIRKKCKPLIEKIVQEQTDSAYINYLIGDATRPVGNGNKIIAHVCNNRGGWGAGFVLALSNKWSDPETCYRSMTVDDLLLGMLQFVHVENDIWVANMVAQNGYKSAENPCPLDYLALETCLKKVQNFAKQINASVHMPRIGCGLAGGKWEDIEPIIQTTLCNFNTPVYVYDLK